MWYTLSISIKIKLNFSRKRICAREIIFTNTGFFFSKGFSFIQSVLKVPCLHHMRDPGEAQACPLRTELDTLHSLLALVPASLLSKSLCSGSLVQAHQKL